MKVIRVLALSLLFVSSVYAQTQAEMDGKAKSDFEKVDLKLNRVYRQIMREYSSDTVFIKNAREAQTLWIKFRDAQVDMKYPPNESGTVLPMCRYYYMQELTAERIKELMPWVNGVEEGDVCSGSVKMK